MDKLKELDIFRKKLPKEIKKIYQLKKHFSIKPSALMSRIYLNIAKKFAKTNKNPLHCKALKSSLFLSTSGDIYPCIIFDKKLGNIRELNYDLKKFWHSQNIKEVRREIKNFKCPQCWTPCEANQTILGNLLQSVYKGLI
jgi:radical SAM protein with 4Fe4S-binding SPASM domain